MIEIICDDEREQNNGAGRIKYDLPRNIRQVGNAPGEYKIYIEDYVMTYLRKIAAPGNINCRGAILLGKTYDDGSGKVLFISGAVDAQNLEFDISMIRFSDSIWSGLYAEINKYFDDLSIVGWFLSRMGFSTSLNEQMKKLHRDNFPGEGKVLFLMDSLECEETFYYYSHGSFVRERGYYIYYVRNERMQNYIISRKCNSSENGSENTIIKDRTVVENFRDKGKKKAANGGKKASATLSVVAAFAISLGALWYVSPDTLSQLAGRLQQQNTGKDVQVFVNSNDDKSTSGAVETVAIDRKEDAAQSSDTEDCVNTEKVVTEMTVTEEKTGEITETATGKTEDTGDNSVANAMCVYQVEEGDTLVSISIKMYGSQEYTETIAKKNNISIDSPIYEGEKLVIPYVE